MGDKTPSIALLIAVFDKYIEQLKKDTYIFKPGEAKGR